MLSVKAVVGKGYNRFWHFKGRYRVVKGSRASKKSKTAALWLIVNMIRYPEANAIVVRKVYRTLKDSCFTELKWAIHRLRCDALWDVKESPLELTYIPTGQKIYFRGFDDPLKITSITVEHGYLCWAWIEEAYEISRENDFDMLDESIRGAIPPETGLFKQITLTFNPWNEKHWLKKRFFDNPDNGTLALTTNYMCNEWLDERDRKLFEEMRVKRPKRYRVAGLGDWGIVEGLVYSNFEEKSFDIDELRRQANIRSAFGLDFGYTNDPTALFCGLVDNAAHVIYVFDELYERGLTNEMIADKIKAMGYGKEKIIADSAEPKSISELYGHGLGRVYACRKGADSVNHGIQTIQNYKIVIHPKCANLLTEINNYCWDTDRAGVMTNKPVGDFNHLMDAMRYAVQGVAAGERFSFD